MVIVKSLKKTYPGYVPVQALKGVSFEVPEGQFLSVMGPSGSGKSTLLHLMALLDDPTSGQILLDGVDVSSLNESGKTDFRLKSLGYIFQEYALIPELNALENAFLPLMLLGRERHQYLEVASEMMVRVGLGNRLHHLMSELSGGEQQRVAIARALVNKSKIIFADEPCASLDSENKGVILRLLRKLCDELSLTILMVTHEPEQREFSDRVIWLRDGLVEKEEIITEDVRKKALSNGFQAEKLSATN